jgi:hypothetical protein
MQMGHVSQIPRHMLGKHASGCWWHAACVPVLAAAVFAVLCLTATTVRGICPLATCRYAADKPPTFLG